MVARKLILIAALGIMAGCSSIPKGGFCAIAKPIRPGAATIATMSDAEVSAVLAHNRKGEKLCGWKP